MDTTFQDGNGKGLEIPVTLVRSVIIEVNDRYTLQVHCNSFEKVFSFMSGFQYASRYCDRLDVCFFVPGMSIHDIFFMT